MMMRRRRRIFNVGRVLVLDNPSALGVMLLDRLGTSALCPAPPNDSALLCTSMQGLTDIARHVTGCRLIQETRVQNSFDEGLIDSARHVIGCHVTQETRVQNAFDDVASNIYQSQPPRD